MWLEGCGFPKKAAVLADGAFLEDTGGAAIGLPTKENAGAGAGAGEKPASPPPKLTDPNRLLVAPPLEALEVSKKENFCQELPHLKQLIERRCR